MREMFQSLKGKIQTGTLCKMIRLFLSRFNPSKVRYKLFLSTTAGLMKSWFQSLKGKIQTCLLVHGRAEVSVVSIPQR